MKLTKSEERRIAQNRCYLCGKKLRPDKEAVIFGTKKWDGHSYLLCKCLGKEAEKLRISIG